MLKLDSIIARLVEDVLRAIRGASLNDLSDLLAASGEWEPAVRPRTRRAKPSELASSQGAPAPTARPRAKRVARAQRPPARVPAAEPKPAAEPPVVAEITDPERLLGAQEPAPPAAEPAPVSEPAVNGGEPHPSAKRPSVGPTAALREGESFARADGVGVVIRRSKRA